MGSLSFKNEKSLQEFRENSNSVITTLHYRVCFFCGKRKDPLGSKTVKIPNSKKSVLKCKDCCLQGD